MVGFKTKEFELCPAGTLPFRCYGVVDFGTQEKEYDGEHYTQPEVNFLLEFPTELMKDGRPFASRAAGFNFSAMLTPKSKLAKFLKSWLPSETIDRNFDFEKLIGRDGMANVVHTPSKDGSKTYANIMSVMPCPKGITVPPMINKSVFVSLDDKWDPDAFAALPVYYQDQIKESPEYNAIQDKLVAGINKFVEGLEE